MKHPRHLQKPLMCCLLVVSLLVSAAFAQEITVESHDENISLTGELLSFDGDTYVLKTGVGQISIAASGVTCMGEGCPQVIQKSRFTITGSSSIGQILMPNLLSELALQQGLDLTESVRSTGENGTPVSQSEFIFLDETDAPKLEITINSSDTDTAFGALLTGSAEIVMSSRTVRNDEVMAFKSVGLGDISDPENQTMIALDGLIIIVSRDNPVSKLTIQQIARVFSGEISNWADLGGPGQHINIYRRADGTGSTSVFSNLIMQPQQQQFSNNAVMVDSDKEISRRVAGDPFGIGYSGYAFENNSRAVAIVDSCGMPFAPTEFNIKTGEYPLSRRLYLYTSNQRFTAFSAAQAGGIQTLLDFVQSKSAQNVVAESGFVSQEIEQLSVDNQGQRLANAFVGDTDDLSLLDIRKMVSDLRDASRLSTTFRFSDGNPVLDKQSTQDIARLVAYLSDLDLAGKEVVFAGFTGSLGTASSNQEASLGHARRAMQLVAAVLERNAGNVDMAAIGYGEAAPLACNNSVFGRALNRRVEVWIRPKT